jgi:predicted ATPase/class 3 adenylate cyclase
VEAHDRSPVGDDVAPKPSPGRAGPRSDLPDSGLVALLFTDIEGSTRLVSALGDERWAGLLADHRALIVEALGREQPAGARWGVVGSEGDSLFAAFASPLGAVRGAANAQRALAAHAWPSGAEIRVRMGIHAGEIVRVGDDYVGYEVHKAARVMSAAHGGQIVLSRTLRALMPDAALAPMELRSLGVHSLKDVPEREELFQLVGEDLSTEFPPLRTLDAVPNNLPAQLTTFVGREAEIVAAKRQLLGTRLLTLTGTGGTGKTRLALRVAEEIAHEYRDGAWFVPLAAVTDPALVPSAIVASLGIAEVSGTSAIHRLCEVLVDRRQLIVLDNFEQVQDAAPSVGEIVRAAPGVAIIATSRGPLHVYGERELPIPPLGLPDLARLPSADALLRSEAVALFVDRAQAARPDFALTDQNAAAVAGICARLDGLPLAIELAAARIRVLAPQAILARLENRLELLSSGGRDRPERQQTLRATIAWSYDLLDPGGQRLLARLGIFAGGWELEQAEAICGPATELGVNVLDGLDGLVNQSLVRLDEGPDGEPRFVMLETIRAFALEQLAASGDADEISRRHAMVFLELAERAAPDLTRAQANAALDRLERSTANLRAALGCAVRTNAADVGLRLGWALWRFWQMRGSLDEGRDWLARLVVLPKALEHPSLLARAYEASGSVAYWRGDMEAARIAYETALSLQREVGDELGVADALYNLSFAYVVPKTDMPKGEALLLEALAIYERSGVDSGIAGVHFSLMNIANQAGDDEARRRHFEVALPTFRRLGDSYMVGWSLHLDGIGLIRLGRFDEARAELTEAISLFARARDVSGIALLLDDWADLALAEGRIARSVQLSGAAAAFQATSGADLGSVINKAEGRSLPDAARLDPETLARAWAEGQAMSLDEAVTYALGTDGPVPDTAAGSPLVAGDGPRSRTGDEADVARGSPHGDTSRSSR